MTYIYMIYSSPCQVSKSKFLIFLWVWKFNSFIISSRGGNQNIVICDIDDQLYTKLGVCIQGHSCHTTVQKMHLMIGLVLDSAILAQLPLNGRL